MITKQLKLDSFSLFFYYFYVKFHIQPVKIHFYCLKILYPYSYFWYQLDTTKNQSLNYHL